jgi:hypothetical protein
MRLVLLRANYNKYAREANEITAHTYSCGVRRSRAECAVSDREASTMRRAWPTRGSGAMEEKNFC